MRTYRPWATGRREPCQAGNRAALNGLLGATQSVCACVLRSICAFPFLLCRPAIAAPNRIFIKLLVLCWQFVFVWTKVVLSIVGCQTSKPHRGVLMFMLVRFSTARCTGVRLAPSRTPFPKFHLFGETSYIPLFLRFPQKLRFCGSPERKKRPLGTTLAGLPLHKPSLVEWAGQPSRKS